MDIASQQTGSLFAYTAIIHDLRNPLAAIHSSAEMLIGSKLSHAHVHRLARNMDCASVRMRELMEEFLERSRDGESKFELSDVRTLVASTVDKIAASAELQSVNNVQIVPEGLIVALDRSRTRGVLVNLLVNALEAMPNGGTIRVSVVSSRRSILIWVRDTGLGIPPEIRGRLFEPFATAQGEWPRAGPCLITAGCDRSWRPDMSRVVPQRSLFCGSPAQTEFRARSLPVMPPEAAPNPCTCKERFPREAS